MYYERASTYNRRINALLAIALIGLLLALPMVASAETKQADKVGATLCKRNPHCAVIKPDTTDEQKTADAVRRATLGHQR